MGRNKISIEKIIDDSKLQITYSKRKHGIIKKAYELSVLSDVDAAFISVSPAGRVSFFSGNNRIEDIFQRYMDTQEAYLNVVGEEREHILNSLRTMRRQNGKALENAEIQELQEELKRKQEEFMEVKEGLSKFEVGEDDKFASLSEVMAREQFLMGALQWVRNQKVKLSASRNLPNESHQNQMCEQMQAEAPPMPLPAEINWMQHNMPVEQMQNEAPLMLLPAEINWMQHNMPVNLSGQPTISSYGESSETYSQPPDPVVDANSAQMMHLPPTAGVDTSSLGTQDKQIAPPPPPTEPERDSAEPFEEDSLAYFLNLPENSSFGDDFDF